MLFNSYEFILFFLPLILLSYWSLGRLNYSLATVLLISGSLFYYGWWNPSYIWLIILSIIINYLFSRRIIFSESSKKSKLYLIAGITFNLSLLGYYKYTDFVIQTFNDITKANIPLQHITLPLAISFFTFQQIAYLVDTYKGNVHKHSFSSYSLFVTFFPQLIAGPIVHHHEMLPQFKKNRDFSWDNLAIGLTLFMVGLFKKVMVADIIAKYSTPVFNAAAHGVTLSFLEAWTGALAYTLQLYYDFSGYSDMAIGIGRMFGIVLPMNFFSPYQSKSISEFWRRWHMTLSRFLRDYLYIPLGGNRKGKIRRLINLMITMLLGGLWHGAAWTFVIWGGLHGIYLVINHMTHDLFTSYRGKRWFGMTSMMITFLAVIIAWVFFRADSLAAALSMLSSMFALNGVGTHLQAIHSIKYYPYLLLLTLHVLFAPNIYEILASHAPALETYKHEYNTAGRLKFSYSMNWAMAVTIAGVIAIIALGRSGSEFLYFNF